MRMTTASSASLRHWGNTPSLLSVCVMDGSEFDARFADQTPEERQILPGLGLFIGSSKQVGRMIADDGLRADEKLTMILFSRNKIRPAVPEPLLAISVNYAIISGNKNYVR